MPGARRSVRLRTMPAPTARTLQVLLGALAAILLAVTVAEIASSGHAHAHAIDYVAAPLFCLPVAFCHRAPLAAIATYAVTGLVVALLGGDLVTHTNTAVFLCMVLVFALAAGTERRRFAAGVAITMVCIPLAGIIEGQSAVGMVAWVGLLPVGLPALVGRMLRGRNELNRRLAGQAQALAAGRAERERAAVFAERARIAHELHDVVAHDVSVMLVQAQAARRIAASDPERAREAIAAIESTGRDALGELRRLLGVLRRGDEELALAPQPSLARLQPLVERVRAAGVPVALAVEGAPRALAPGVDATAFRIVQEALANVLRHAGASRAEVRIAYQAGDLELAVRDDGSGDGTVAPEGHGLIGLRERVGLYGGELRAGPHGRGGYELRARLPIGEAQAPA
jgi:signal transduction histidine kinase